MTQRLRHLPVPLLFLACLVAGGASAAGHWSNLALQLASLPLLVAAAVARRGSPLNAASRQVLLLLAATLALVALQLLPLPPALWSHLPGRAPVADGFRILGLPLPWLPLSLEPYRTVASALWLLPAAAVLLGIVVLGVYRASWIAWCLAGVAIVGVALGALQLAGGEGSVAYLYEITNHGAMTGFFANANHFATLLFATIPFLAALYCKATAKDRSIKRSSGLLVILAGILALICVGFAGAASIAGIAIALPVLAASVILVISRNRRPPRWSGAVLVLLVAGSVAGAFASPFNNNLTGKQAHTAEDSRQRSFSITAQAAREYFPLGSGIGTFQEVYRQHEDPAAINRFYMNHAHSDYLELALETGLPGLLLIAVFILWWGRRTWLLWRTDNPDPFARAATIAVGGILAHSLVDYPLRTAAVSALFAVCCALMAEPRSKVQTRTSRDAGSSARHLSAD